ncbi:hypothetical protein WJX75_002752 [Coccomyxa subellipsoidea]|uniref:Uncharacterized protein n=1 Tax=Coccomyxa subellipsoidea TaxID=248742 RepID=A0ABR2YVN4_9CHLO
MAMAGGREHLCTDDDLGDGVTVVLARCTAVLVPLKLESQSRTGSRCNQVHSPQRRRGQACKTEQDPQGR